MADPVQDLAGFFAGHGPVVEVSVTGTYGSVPRGCDAMMYVAEAATHGTIGGGQLEWMAMAEARAILQGHRPSGDMNVPLGPDIGQCCGGRVVLRLRRLDADGRALAVARLRQARAGLPVVLVLGAGHVGRALADVLAGMPVHAALIDSRADQLALCTADVDTRLTALPEAEIAAAPPGSAFVVLTHDHGLDFLLTSAALARRDAAYVGMIGSATKRAKFGRWCRDQGEGVAPDGLTCPIGAAGLGDKRPEVIALMTAAEAVSALGGARNRTLAPPDDDMSALPARPRMRR